MKTIGIAALVSILLLVGQVRADLPVAHFKNLQPTYDNVEEIRKWASGACFGGCEVKELNLSGRHVVVVIGQPTSGICTSEIVVFSGNPGEKLDYVLHRQLVEGIARVKITGDSIGIDVYDNTDDTPTPLLIIPQGGY